MPSGAARSDAPSARVRVIGNIMLVIPGMQLTNSLRDMINGDTVSGVLNLSEAILKAVSVALGFAIVLLAGG